MTTSEHTNEIAAALAAAQAKFKPIAKNRTAKIESQKGSYSYDYADLADVIEATREGLSANGLALTQPITIDGEQLILVTRLIHSSGQWLESVYPIAVGSRAQDTGAAITYGRRYCVSALLGVASEADTDGKDVPSEAPAGKPKTISAKQTGLIEGLCKQKEVGAEFRDRIIQAKWATTVKGLSSAQASEFITFLQNVTREQLDALALKYYGEPEPTEEDVPLGEPLETPA